MSRELRLPARAWAGVLVAVVVTLLVLCIVATYTPVFHARNIRVSGTHELTAAAVISRAGVGSSTNVFHLDVDRVRTELEQDPWIRRATVERDLPDSIVIHVSEREPIAEALEGTGTVVVAGDGVVLPDAPTGGLPQIRGALGDLSGDQRAAAARALAAMPPALRARVTAVVVDSSGTLNAELAGGLTVNLGTGGDDAAKAAALRAVLRWAAGESVTLSSIDVSVPTAPSATLGDGSTISP